MKGESGGTDGMRVRRGKEGGLTEKEGRYHQSQGRQCQPWHESREMSITSGHAKSPKHVLCLVQFLSSVNQYRHEVAVWAGCVQTDLPGD